MMEEPWRVELEPARLSTGSHSLRFEAEYMDGTLPAFLAYTIVVGQSVTWTQDVLPIMQEHCARCHGTEESASTRLDTQQAWIDNADSIIYNLREGRMPLDDEALAASDVDLVSAWKASGFPE
jgi:mono/diheme cytochrome c family protein